MKGIDDIRNKKIYETPENPEQEKKNKDFQKKIFKEYHHSILSRITKTLNPGAFADSDKQSYMIELKRRGLQRPSSKDEDLLK